MADSWVALKRIQRMESTLAEWYGWLSDRFSDESEVGGLFSSLSHEEAGHGELARFQSRIVLTNPAHFPPVDVDLNSLDTALAAIHQVREGPALSLEEALRFSHHLECSLAEQYSPRAVTKTDPDLARLIESLSEDCDRHHAKLGDLARRCGVSLQ